LTFVTLRPTIDTVKIRVAFCLTCVGVTFIFALNDSGHW